MDNADILGGLPIKDCEAPKTVFGGSLNYRPLFFAALALIAGIVISAAVFGKNPHTLVIFIILALFFVSGIVLAFFKKPLFIWISGFLLLGYVLFFISYSLGEVTPAIVEDAVITGKVARITTESDKVIGENSEEGYYVYILEDIKIDAAAARGNAYLICKDFYYVGAKVSARGLLTTFNLDPFDTFSMSYYNNDIKHIIDAESVTLTGYEKPGFFDRIHESIKEKYSSVMSAESAGVALSLVLGDKSILNKEINDYFRAAGLSHIFAVSGLHVGFLVGIIFFICRKMKLGRYFAFAASFAAMLCYGIVTGFAPSIMRATIMTSAAFLSFLLFRRLDPLNTLSLAAIAVLIVKPLAIFEVGFQMSFSAVLGIVCFYGPLKKRLTLGKNAFARFAGSSLALSLSANSFVFVVAVNTFSAYGVYFCLSNFILIPMVSIIYSLTMLASAICLVIPQAGILLVPLDYLYKPIIYIAKFISELPGAVQIGNKLGIIGFVYSLNLFYMSRFFMVSQKTKYRVLTAAVAFSLMYIIIFL